MVGALGGAQAGMQGQLALANDPLTLHLAKLSRSQLNEIISEMKVGNWEKVCMSLMVF